MSRRLSLTFAAGVVGALVNSLVVWAAGAHGLTAALGVHLAPGLSAGWLYPRLAWGGLWGLLFLVPLRARSGVALGLLVSLAPTLAQCLWFFPRAGAGYFGLHLGMLTPVLVLLFNAIWGVAAALWLRASGGR